MVTATRRAAIYARISQDRDGTMLGVERQRADCERLVERNGWEVAGLYVDNDISAYSGRKRPEYERLLDDMNAGAIDAVVAWDPDRLHRSPKELETFIDAVEARGIAVETATAGSFDLSTPSGRAIARTLGAWARYESDHKAERIRRKHEELAERGEPIRGGWRAFGLSRDWTRLLPDEAALVREAVERILAGDSLRGIAADWNQRGIVTTTGGRWQQQPLRRMLTSARLAGLREHNGHTVTGTWPAIVDVKTLERLRAILTAPERRKGDPKARRYLLTGFLHCSVCERRLVARPRSDKVRRYICAKGPMYEGCGRTYILAEPTEQIVEAMVVDAIDSPELAEAVNGTPSNRTRELLETIREDNHRLDKLFSGGR